jgi:hypothetical protein
MPIQLAIANISLDTATVSRQGFGTICFIGKHNYFADRIVSFSSPQAMTEDGIPTTSALYRAAVTAFSQTPSPTSMKFGRQESDSIFTVTGLSTGSSHSLTISTSGAFTGNFDYTSLVGDDEDDVVDALLTLIAIDTDVSGKIVASKIGTGSAAQLSITQEVTGDWFVPSLIVGMTESFTSVEVAADTMTAIVDEDDNFYYVAIEERDVTYVKAIAVDIESRLKYFRTSSNTATHYAATPTGILVDLNIYDRSSGFLHHDSGVTYPEVGALAEIASAVTGSVSYANRRVSAVSPSLNDKGKVLTSTQQEKLTTNNIDFFTRVGNAATDPVITVIGKTGSGEYIDNIVARDNMKVDIQAAFTNLLINQKNSKVTLNNAGANQLRGVLRTVLNSYTTKGVHNFIEVDFEINIPDEVDFSAESRTTRKFTQINFTANLTNAIHMVVITGTLKI